MENEARHIPHPSVPLPCQPNGRCDGAGPPAPSSTPRLALVCWTTVHELSVSLSHAMCCFAGPMHIRRGGAKRTKASDHYAGHAQRLAVVMAQADQATTKFPNRHGAPSDRATMQQRQGVLTLRGVRPVTARQACMAQGARRAEKHGPARVMEVLERNWRGARDGRVVRRTTLPIASRPREVASQALWKHTFLSKKGAVRRATLWKHRARLLLPAAQRSAGPPRALLMLRSPRTRA